MIENLPLWLEILFIVTCVITIAFFYYSNGKPKRVAFILILWSIIQALLAYTGFYQNSDAVLPRFGLVIIPAVVLIIFGLLPKQQKWFFENRNIKISTFLHSVRIPVEIVLYGLFTHNMVPELMTFEGRNFDILIGITALLVGWLFLKQRISKQMLLIWNIVGLIFVLFILINGLLSAELPFQLFAFEQPNRAVNYFPFILLPATIVPIVIWTHLSDILTLRRALKSIDPNI